MNKSSFKKQFDASMAQVEIDIQLKRRLSHQLFSMKSHKKTFWSRYKAYFVLPAGATLAIALFFTMKHSLSPSQALADAMKNTFNLETFETTFGMPNDGDLHHRLITRTYMGIPEDNTNVVLDEENITETVNLWFDGENVREDHKYETSKISDAFSAMANVKGDILCFKGVMFGNQGCNPLSEFQDGLKELTNDRGFIPEFKEELLTGPQDITIKPYSEDSKEPKILTFSTLKPIPINGAHVRIGANPSKWFFAGLLQDSNSSGEFINKEEKGKYWHSFIVYAYDEDTIYFQVNEMKEMVTNEGKDSDFSMENIKKASMIYKINEDGIIPLSAEKFKEQLTLPENYSIVQLIKKELLASTLKPAFYIMRHPQEFSEPLKVYKTNKNKKSLYALQYVLQDPSLVNSSFDSNLEYQIELYMDTSQVKFLGYSITQDSKEVESLWLEDTVLSNEDKAKVFDKGAWTKEWLE